MHTYSDTDTHPAWCDAHAAFPDGSESWHKSSARTLGGHSVYLVEGDDGAPEIHMDFVSNEGIDWLTLDGAEAWAKLILKMVEAGRATSGSEAVAR